MTSQSVINMIKKFTQKFGVEVTWNEQIEEYNSRGEVIASNNGQVKKAKVLILKEKFTVLKSIEAVIGLTQDYTRYVLTLPDIDIKKDVVITDQHNMKWKIGVVDWFDVGGVSVAKQAALTEVI